MTRLHWQINLTMSMTATVLVLLAAPVAASSPWSSSVYLPAGGSIATPPLTISGSWALDWWYLPGPGSVLEIATPGAGIWCAQLVCAALVHTSGADVAVSVGGVYPYSAQAYRLAVRVAGGTVEASLYAGGALVDSGSATAGTVSVAGSITVTEWGGDALYGPMRLWSTADPPLALYRHPALTDPGLAGLWDPVVGSALLDLVAGKDATLTGGAAGHAPICWRDPAELIFWDGFETGNTLRWVLVPGGADVDPPVIPDP